MLSFKQYRQLNENFGPMTLGLGQLRSVGVVGATGISMEEGKKCGKSCKKMDVDDDMPEEKDDDEVEEKGGVQVVGKGKKGKDDDGEEKGEKEDKGDEEGGDEKPSFFQKKKSKKKMQAEGLFGKKLGKAPPPEMGGGEDEMGGVGIGADMGGEEGDDLGGGEEDGEEDLGDDDLGDDDELGDDDDLEGDDEEGDLGDDLGGEPGEDEMGNLGKSKLGKLGKGKKPPMDDMGGDAPMFMTKHSRKGMTKEQAEWWDSVEGQMNADPDPRFFDGFSEIKSVEQGVRQEPKAGDVGFAPQGRIGSWF